MRKPSMPAPAVVIVAAAVAAVAVAAFAWRFGGRAASEESESAWSRLPPETAWAAEARGVAGLLRRGMNDAGVRLLLRRSAEELDNAASAAGHSGTEPSVTDGTQTFAARLEHAMDLYGVLSGAVTVLAPETLVVGQGARGAFALCRPPAGTGAFVGNYPATTYFESIGAHFTLHDGVLVAAENTGAIDDIVTNWDGGARPLGTEYAGPAGTAQSITIAVASGVTGGSLRPPVRPPASSPPLAPLAPPPPAEQRQQQQPPPPGGMLVFRNPFTSAANVTAAEATPAGPAFVMTIVPEPEGWSISGRAGEWAGGAGEAEKWADLPEGAPPAGRAVTAAAAFSAPAREALLARLLQLTDAQHYSPPPRLALLANWLLRMLGRVGDNVTLMAGAPAGAEAGQSYAPIPQLALGWTWSRPPTGEDFTRSLTKGLAALHAPGGGAAGDVLRAALRYRTEGTPLGRAVVLTLPAPLVNGAEPSALAGTDGMGWLASAPEALPKEQGEGGELLRKIPPPADGEARVHAVWRITPEFRAGAAAFAAERWRAVPTRRRGENSTLASIARWAEWTSAAFPNGRLAARVRSADGRAQWRAVVRREETEK